MTDYQNFQILSPSTKEDREIVIQELLSGGVGNETPGKVIIELFLPGGPASTLSNCETVIIENDYHDEDYMDSYIRYYLFSIKIIPKNARECISLNPR